ncbi:hypothetical protein BaRGS_00033967 [Batillaria attramentaria]|uniref:Sialate O-acetylesterase domain-containing protein n=1 Tax=Batillaria attramentaria TaxID=370345 RepID=A0ABD0JIV6_9CAEN
MALSVVAALIFLLPMTIGQNVVRMHQNDFDRFSVGGGQKQKAGRFAFASYYSDHMVLQQAPQRAVIWGFYPDVGDRIIVKVSGLSKAYPADVKPGPSAGEGVWSVSLDPISSAAAFTITAMADDGASISISDVLFGDVWVCSGQSNMQFTTYQIDNATEELDQASKYTNIRLFTVADTYSTTPLTDLTKIAEQWTLPNSTTVGAAPFTYFSAVCWLFGRRLYEELGYPIGLVDTTWGGTPVEAWSSPDALAKCGLKANQEKASNTPTKKYTTLEGPDDNSQLWNAMVNPLLKMTIYGAIWYQGEADSREPKMHMYNCTFPAMIDDWRAKWSAQTGETSPTFPFGFVQLAGNQPDMSIISGFPDVRWHQTADYGYVPNPRMKNVFMAVAMDLPDFTSPWGSIHPRDKQDVAQRLYLSGLDIAYNRPQKHFGPRPANITQSGVYINLFYGTEWTIKVRNQEGFELCCTVNGQDECTQKNSWWLPSPIMDWDSSSVSLDGMVCGEGQYAAGIRYAWRESPCVFKRCAVYAEVNELPAPPFISTKPKGSSTEFSYTIDWSKPQIIP